MNEFECPNPGKCTVSQFGSASGCVVCKELWPLLKKADAELEDLRSADPSWYSWLCETLGFDPKASTPGEVRNRVVMHRDRVSWLERIIARTATAPKTPLLDFSDEEARALAAQMEATTPSEPWPEQQAKEVESTGCADKPDMGCEHEDLPKYIPGVPMPPMAPTRDAREAKVGKPKGLRVDEYQSLKARLGVGSVDSAPLTVELWDRTAEALMEAWRQRAEKAAEAASTEVERRLARLEQITSAEPWRTLHQQIDQVANLEASLDRVIARVGMLEHGALEAARVARERAAATDQRLNVLMTQAAEQKQEQAQAQLKRRKR